jgi:hypothetical protein
MVYVKNRSAASDPTFSDAVRGITKVLYTDSTAGESTAPSFGYINSVSSTGINVNSGGGTEANFNKNTQAYVAWNWLAGNSTSSNTSGSITSTVSAGATQGFSVVTYTGTGTAATIGHGLGVAPKMIIVKRRDSAGNNWPVYHVSTGASNIPYLENTSAYFTRAGNFNNTAPTSAVFSVGGSGQTDYTNTNASGGTYVAYCFAEVAGYSKFGSYTGNGSADGTFVYLGFRPRWLMVHCSSAGISDWPIYDTSRPTYNQSRQVLYADLSNAEASAGLAIDLLSNGFKWREAGGQGNDSGQTYIFAAFAENPFKISLAR